MHRSLLVVFLLLLVLLVLGGLIGLIKHMAGKVYYKKTGWILSGYIALLLISFIFMYMLPKDDFSATEIAGQNDPWLAGHEYLDLDLWTAAEEGRLHQVEGAHKNGEWSFEYTEKQLEIAAVDGGLNTQVVVRNKEVDDGIIEAASFTGQAIINEIDYTDKIKPPGLILEGHQLKITNSEGLKIELARFDRDFTIKQFLPEGRINNNYRYSAGRIYRSGPPVLYIQVPKSLQVNENY